MTTATYRLIWLDQDGRALKSTHVNCVTDDEAIDVAQQQTGDYAVIEVWDGSRAVCRCGNPREAERGS